MSRALFRCLCGHVHSLDRETVMDRLAADEWRCTPCGRRFVLVHEPPDTFTPVFVDPQSQAHTVHETGVETDPTVSSRPLPPPAVDFRCRCGARLTAHSWMYGTHMECDRCRTPMLLALKFNPRRAWYVIEPEYPPADTRVLQAVRAPLPPPRPAAPPPAPLPAIAPRPRAERRARLRRAYGR